MCIERGLDGCYLRNDACDLRVLSFHLHFLGLDLCLLSLHLHRLSLDLLLLDQGLLFFRSFNQQRG